MIEEILEGVKYTVKDRKIYIEGEIEGYKVIELWRLGYNVIIKK